MLFLGIVVAVVVFIVGVAWWAHRSGRDATTRCAACSYDLTSCDPRTTERCPECGAVILETGVHRRGASGGRAKRRAGSALALCCALGLGFLLLLRFPPVMQSHRVSAMGSLGLVGGGPPLRVSRLSVKHPGYTTSPLVYVVPGLREEQTIERSLVLTRSGASRLDVHETDDARGAALAWSTDQTHPLVPADVESLGEALANEGFDTSRLYPERDHPNLAMRSMLLGATFRWTSTTRTSPSAQSSLAQRLGLAPSVGVDWDHTTWLQVSNSAWYVMPVVGTVWLFWWSGRRSRRSAVVRARAWIGDV